MDWQPTEMQAAIKELSAKILSGAEDPWEELNKAELLGLDNLLDITTLLIEVGRSGSHVPALSTLILGAPIRSFVQDLAPGTVTTAGLLEEHSRDPRHPNTRAEDGKLYGSKICVPAADIAEYIVVPATEGIYAAKLEDCTVELQTGTDGDPLGIVTFEGTPGQRMGGAELFDSWLPGIDVGISALLLGVAKKALKLTATYVNERHQFGRPIGSFQAVQHRSADAWINTQIMEVCLWQAAWRVEQGLASERERAICRYWAAEGAHQVTAAAQHLHGGFGFDRDYELHRYFLVAKQWEFLLGGANAQLEKLGELLARS